jgi:hypothetical protein
MAKPYERSRYHCDTLLYQHYWSVEEKLPVIERLTLGEFCVVCSFFFFDFFSFSFLPLFSFRPHLQIKLPTSNHNTDDMALIQRSLFASLKIESLIHGNVTSTEAIQLIKKIESRFQSKLPLPLVCLFLHFFISSFLHFFISSFLHFFISAFLHFFISSFLHFSFLISSSFHTSHLILLVAIPRQTHPSPPTIL